MIRTWTAIEIGIALPGFGNTPASGGASKLTVIAGGILTERQLLIGSVVTVLVAVAHPRRRYAADGLAFELIVAAGDVLASASGRRVLIRLIRTVEIAVAEETFADAGATATALELVDRIAGGGLFRRRHRARAVGRCVRLETVAAQTDAAFGDGHAQVDARVLPAAVFTCHTSFMLTVNINHISHTHSVDIAIKRSISSSPYHTPFILIAF